MYGMYWLCKLALKILSGIAPKCQTVWIKIRLKKIVWSDLDQNSLQSSLLSADDRSQQSISHEYEGALHWVTLYVEVMF